MRAAGGTFALAVTGTNADLAVGRCVLVGARWGLVFARSELAEARDVALRAEEVLEVELSFRLAPGRAPLAGWRRNGGTTSSGVGAAVFSLTDASS